MHQRGMAAAAALPADTTEGTTPAPEATPTGEQQAETATTEVDSFSRLDPNTLPAELRPYYESMQGDYTRKTQEIAPYRQLAQETGLDVDGLRQSAELYQALQDPQQIVQFHSELTEALQAQGLSRAEATQAATQHITETQQGGGDDLSHLDPEERRIQDLETRLKSFEESQQRDAAQRAAEQRAGALVAEMNRQEMVVKESYPNWKQEDIDAVYEMSAFYGGNLVDAAKRLDDYTSSKLANILNGKGEAASNPGLAPLPSATSGLTRGMNFGDNLDAAHKAAQEAVKQLPWPPNQ